MADFVGVCVGPKAYPIGKSGFCRGASPSTTSIFLAQNNQFQIPEISRCFIGNYRRLPRCSHFKHTADYRSLPRLFVGILLEFHWIEEMRSQLKTKFIFSDYSSSLNRNFNTTTKEVLMDKQREPYAFEEGDPVPDYENESQEILWSEEPYHSKPFEQLTRQEAFNLKEQWMQKLNALMVHKGNLVKEEKDVRARLFEVDMLIVRKGWDKQH